MPKKTYRKKMGRKSVILKYMLMSVNAERMIIRVGVFPKGIWKEVPMAIYQSFKDADGWKGKVEQEEIKGGKT